MGRGAGGLAAYHVVNEIQSPACAPLQAVGHPALDPVWMARHPGAALSANGREMRFQDYRQGGQIHSQRNHGPSFG